MISILAAVALTCTPVATDGDSIRCGSERIRLLAIDAPEMGPCQPVGRKCVQGDPVASRNSLATAMKGGRVTIARTGTDRYGRTLARVFVNGKDLSCHQIQTGHAAYIRKWDTHNEVKNNCGMSDE